MPTNDFKPFATGKDANVLTQTEYEKLDAVDNGFQSGIARSEQLNKVWRQASTIASVVASFMADKSGDNVLDDGDAEKLQQTLLKALLNNSVAQLDSRYLHKNNNLADLTNKEAARNNLGLDLRYLQKASNLADVPDKGAARNNLELGGLATKNNLSAADVGAYPVTGGELKGEAWSYAADNYRIICQDRGAFWRFDGVNYYLMFTNEGDSLGGWNDKRPLYIDYSTGNIATNHLFTAVKGVHSYENVSAANIVANSVVYSGNGAASMQPDGNIYGSVWGGWLNNWIHNNRGQLSVSGNQWWAKINLNGGTLIIQGGLSMGNQTNEVINVGLNISVPNRLLWVGITTRNYAQGYEVTYNPQIQQLDGRTSNFGWVHGVKEHQMYWVAIGY